MKWRDTGALSEQWSLLKHIASGRQAVFIRRNDELTGTIDVCFLDERTPIRVSPRDFIRVEQPNGTVPRMT